MTLQSFVSREGIKFDATWADSNPNMSDMPPGSTHWLCRIRKGRRVMRVPFSQGPAICKEPTAEDVLNCLASDACGFENAGSFEEWCSEYGYDADSRKAERIYHAIEKQVADMNRVLGDSYKKLVFETECL